MSVQFTGADPVRFVLLVLEDTSIAKPVLFVFPVECQVKVRGKVEGK